MVLMQTATDSANMMVAHMPSHKPTAELHGETMIHDDIQGVELTGLKNAPLSGALCHLWFCSECTNSTIYCHGSSKGKNRPLS